MTAEQELASKLELIRDSITGFKFATKALEDRAEKLELDLADCRLKISDLSNNSIRVESQLATNNKAMDTMSIDIRAVRNSVLSAILAAVIIWVAGTAFSTLHRSSPTTGIKSASLPRDTLAIAGVTV